MGVVTKHGYTFFLTRGVLCPECFSEQFTINTKLVTPIPTMRDGIYELKCKLCDCEWQETVTNEQIINN